MPAYGQSKHPGSRARPALATVTPGYGDKAPGCSIISFTRPQFKPCERHQEPGQGTDPTHPVLPGTCLRADQVWLAELQLESPLRLELWFSSDSSSQVSGSSGSRGRHIWSDVCHSETVSMQNNPRWAGL